MMVNDQNNSSDSNSKSDTSDFQSSSSSPIQEAFHRVWDTVRKVADPRTERRFSVPGFLRRESSSTSSTSPPRPASSEQVSPVRTPPEAKQLETRRSSTSPKDRPQSSRTLSVPVLFRKYPSSRRPPSPEQEQEVRPGDEEDSKFGQTLIGLLGRNKSSRYLLNPTTLNKLDKEIADDRNQKAKQGSRLTTALKSESKQPITGRRSKQGGR